MLPYPQTFFCFLPQIKMTRFPIKMLNLLAALLFVTAHDTTFALKAEHNQNLRKKSLINNYDIDNNNAMRILESPTIITAKIINTEDYDNELSFQNKNNQFQHYTGERLNDNIDSISTRRELLDFKNATDAAKDKILDTANEVEETLNAPPSTWSQYQWILIIAIIAVGGCIIGCAIKCFCCRK